MKPRITRKQIIAAPTETGVGKVGHELCCTQAGQNSPETRCAQLEEENRRLKFLVADLTLRNEALKLVVSKKW